MSEANAKNPYLVLKLKEFRSYLLMRLLITVSTQIQAVVVGWQIYEITKDPLSLGLIGLAEAVPSIGVALFAGYIADILNRKKIVFTAYSVLFLCSFSLFFLTLDLTTVLHDFGASPIYFIIFISGIARGFMVPATFGLFSQIVPKELVPNGAAWNSTVWQSAAVAGPALGGLLYGFLGITVTYATDAILVIAGIFLLLTIASKPVPKHEVKLSLFENLTSGIKFVFKNQIILNAISLDLFAVLFGGAVALLPIFASDVLKVGPEGLGLLRAAPAVGAVLMAIFLAHHPPKHKAGMNLLFCVAGFGICMILFAVSKNFYFSLSVLALSGAFDSVSVVIRSTIMQVFTPDNMKGRVSSVNNIFVGSSNEIGAFESGLAAKVLGVIPSVIFGGTMTLIVVAYTSWKSKTIRQLNL